jgi:glucosyl-3-phosphoglycerate synthase
VTRSPLRAIVVVPARDEQECIGSCLLALAAQREIDASSFEVFLVLDHCHDDTRGRALVASSTAERLTLTILDSLIPGVGHARRAGMDAACRRLLDAGVPDGLIATTDADSRVAPDWLAVQIELAAAGARAIGGRIELDSHEAALLPPGVLTSRQDQARERLASIRSGDARDGSAHREHHQFSGASLAVTARTYEEVGGLPDVEALEDEALERLLEARQIPIVRSKRVRVVTSARTQGRAPRGLARHRALSCGGARRSYRARDFDATQLARLKRESITAILPAREVADTIGAIIKQIRPLRDAGLIDRILVIDAASADGTAAVAAAAGADVRQQDDLLRDHGPARGKGDAMWRALSATDGGIVVFLDADTRGFTPDFVVGLLGPIMTNTEIRFVKGAFRRPFDTGERILPDEGGRVTELVARPLLNLYAPHLAVFDQPLAGEIAAYSEDLRDLCFPAGYGVEIANLLDVARMAGTDALAQVDLGQRQNRHQPLRDLTAMAYAVMVAAARRLHDAGLPQPAVPGPLMLPPTAPGTAAEARQVVTFERPPLNSLEPAAVVVGNANVAGKSAGTQTHLDLAARGS